MKVHEESLKEREVRIQTVNRNLKEVLIIFL